MTEKDYERIEDLFAEKRRLNRSKAITMPERNELVCIEFMNYKEGVLYRIDVDSKIYELLRKMVDWHNDKDGRAGELEKEIEKIQVIFND